MNIKSLIPFASLLLLMVSCQSEEMATNGPEGATQRKTEMREVIISAEMEEESSTDTRTVLMLDQSVSPAKQRLYWLPNDEMMVFSNGEASKFVSMNTAPSRKAKFSGQVSFVIGDDGETEKDYVWGLYPYRADAEYSEPDGSSATAVITTTLPDVQTGKPGTFDSGLATMIGRSETLTFSYKAAYSGVYIRFNRDDIISVTLRGRHDEVLAGRFVLGLDDNLNPEVKSIVSPSRSVTVYAPDGGTFEPGQNYYIITLPDVQLQEGYYLTVYRNDGKYASFTSLTTVHDLPRNGCRSFTNPLDTYIENEANIASGRSTGWLASYSQRSNEIWYATLDNEAVTYTPTPHFGNVVEKIIAPKDNDGTGIIRFKGPLKQTDHFAFGENGNDNLISLSLPETVESINQYSFAYCSNLSSISLGKNVKAIRSCAFVNCSMSNIGLPEGLETIEAAAFVGCQGLKSVKIPESVTSIGADGNTGVLVTPFPNCSSLKTFYGKYATPDGKALIVDDYLLSFATGGMNEAGYAVPSNVKHIGFQAFEDATIGSIILPEGLKTIYDFAFNYCSNLTSITIPSTVEAIYRCAFWGCSSLQSITILREDKVMQAKITNEDEAFDGYGIFESTNNCPIFVPENALNWYKYGQHWDVYGNKLGDGCRYQTPQPVNEIWYTVVDGTSPDDAVGVTDWSSWNGNTWLGTSYDSSKKMYVAKFQNALAWIPDEAFRRNLALKSVFLPPVTGYSMEIGERAFENCSNLEFVQFGESYETIYDYAFASCNLKSVVVPNTNSLGNHAFSYNHNLTSVALSESINDWPSSSNPFMACESILGFTGDNDMVADGGRCLILGDKLVSYATASTTGTYTIPANVKEIATQALYGAQFQDVVLPEGLTDIGWASLAQCTNLKQLVIPESVTWIDGHFISDSHRLGYVIMNGLTPPEISEHAFDEIANGLLIKVPGAGSLAYFDDDNWQELCGRFVIYQTNREIWYHLEGDEGSTVGHWGGDFGASLSSATILPTVNRYEPIIYPPSSISLTGSTFLSTIFNGDVTKVAPYTFGKTEHDSYTSEKVDFVSLPPTVTEIGEGAFKDCSKLLLVPFSDYYIEIIGDDAFNGCTSLLLDLEDSEIPSYGLWTYFRLTSIGARAFKGCTSLNWPIMCTNRMTIGDSAFEGSSLRGFVFSNVTDLGKSAFKNCQDLDKYGGPCWIGGLMTEIKDSTFYGCSTLDELALTVGSPITAIGQSAFQGCNSLETIGYWGANSYVEGVAQLPTIERLKGGLTFLSTNIKVLKLPDLKSINGGIEFSYSPINQLELPSLESAASNAFLSMPDLEELYLPSIKSLGTDMFTPGVLRKLHLGPNISSLNYRLWGYGSSPTTFEVELYLDSVTPPSVSANTFDCRQSGGGNQILAVRAVYVPSGSVNAYKQSTAWANALAVAGATTDVIQAMPTN